MGEMTGQPMDQPMYQLRPIGPDTPADERGAAPVAALDAAPREPFSAGHERPPLPG